MNGASMLKPPLGGGGIPIRGTGEGSAARTARALVRPLDRAARALRTSRLNWATPAWISVAAALALSVLGLDAIATTEPAHALRQGIFLGVALLAAAAAALPGTRFVQRASWVLFGVTVALLVFVMLPGVPDWLVHPRNGSRRWINLGVTDFQPSEVAKIAWILVMAEWLRGTSAHRTFTGLAVPFAITFVPLVLVLVEPDLGTSMLFVPTLFAMLLAAGARKRHIAAIVLMGAVAAPLTYPFLRPHQRERIDALIAQVQGDDRFAQGIGFQGDRAMTLAGAGGLTGVGREHARALVIHNALPEEHNDMIFSVVCCRWGFLGGAFVWLLTLAFAAGGLLTAALVRQPFGRLVAVGVVAIVISQAVINTGMNIGVLPITGMTLPFVSYGGSSLVTTWAMVGLVLGIGLRRPRRMERDSFQFDE